MSKLCIVKKVEGSILLLINISKKPPINQAVWLSNRRVFTEYSTNLVIFVAKLALVLEFSHNNN